MEGVLVYAAIGVLSYIIFRVYLKITQGYWWDSSDELLVFVFALFWVVTLPLGIAYIAFRVIGAGVDLVIDMVTEEINHRKRKNERKRTTGNLDQL